MHEHEGDKGFQIRQDVQLGKLRRKLLVPAVLISLLATSTVQRYNCIGTARAFSAQCKRCTPYKAFNVALPCLDRRALGAVVSWHNVHEIDKSRVLGLVLLRQASEFLSADVGDRKEGGTGRELGERERGRQATGRDGDGGRRCAGRETLHQLPAVVVGRHARDQTVQQAGRSRAL